MPFFAKGKGMMVGWIGPCWGWETLVWLPPPFFIFSEWWLRGRYRYSRSRSVSIVLWYGGLCGVSLPYNTDIGMSERDGARVDDGLMDGRTGLRWRREGESEPLSACGARLWNRTELEWSIATSTVSILPYCAVNLPQRSQVYSTR